MWVFILCCGRALQGGGPIAGEGGLSVIVGDFDLAESEADVLERARVGGIAGAWDSEILANRRDGSLGELDGLVDVFLAVGCNFNEVELDVRENFIGGGGTEDLGRGTIPEFGEGHRGILVFADGLAGGGIARRTKLDGKTQALDLVAMRRIGGIAPKRALFGALNGDEENWRGVCGHDGHDHAGARGTLSARGLKRCEDEDKQNQDEKEELAIHERPPEFGKGHGIVDAAFYKEERVEGTGKAQDEETTFWGVFRPAKKRQHLGRGI